MLTGVDSHICVETAVRNGFELGYKIVVSEDLIATNGTPWRQAMQERTLDLVRDIL